MTTKEVLAELKKMGSSQTAGTLKKHGVI